MYETGADFTNSFRKLSQLKLTGAEKVDDDIKQYLQDFLTECSSVDEFIALNRPKMPRE